MKGDKAPAKKTLKRDGKKKTKKSKTETYKIYIYKVLKQVHPDTGVSNKVTSIVDCFINELFDRKKLKKERSRKRC